MTAILLDGEALANDMKMQLATTVAELIAAGVTPGIRDACPSVCGITFPSFSCISRDNPLTAW